MVNCSFPSCDAELACIITILGVAYAFCAAHIPPDAIVPIRAGKKPCAHPGCKFARTRGLIRNKRISLTHCRIHASEKLIRGGGCCDIPGCVKQARYGYEKGTPIMCGEHTEPDMSDVVSILCEGTGSTKCHKQATHNFLSMKEAEGPRFCSQHAKGKIGPDGKEVMINIKLTHRCACGKVPSWAPEGSKTNTHCATCAKALMKTDKTIKLVDKHDVCDFVNDDGVQCTTQASRHFDDAEGVRHHRCGPHGEGHDDGNKKCGFIDESGIPCTMTPSYGTDGTAQKHCIKHATIIAEREGKSADDVRNIKAILCKEHGVRCTFALPGQPARYCVNCAPEGAQSTDSRVCIYRETLGGEICGTRASFALPGDKPQFGAGHAMLVNEAMVNVVERTCDDPSCHSIPSFGYTPEYIASHTGACMPVAAAAAADAIEVTGIINPRELRCKVHALEGMVDVRHPRCITCGERAFYRMPDTKRTEYCYYCHPEGAISECTRCVGIDGIPCEKRASAGPLFGQAVHCAEHANARTKKNLPRFCEFEHRFPRCMGEPACPYRPTLSMDEENTPTHCPHHAPDTAHPIILTTTLCARCNVPSIVNALNGTCAHCEFGMIRADPRKAGAKERRMRKCIADQHMIAAHNKQLRCDPAANIKDRPDFLFTCEGFSIILEVDEFQHQRAVRISELTDITDFAVCLERVDGSEPAAPERRRGYTRNREIARMVIIQRALNVPVVFIRYNPDSFVTGGGIHHSESRGAARDVIAVNLVQRLIARARERTAAPFDAQLCVAYIDYDGQEPGIPDIFNIDYEASMISRIPFV